MKYLKTLTYLIISLNIYVAFAQSDLNDTSQISAFYDALQDNYITAEALENLTPNFKLQNHSQTLNNLSRYTITIAGVMQNDWTQVVVSDLKIEATKNNLILVSGLLSGRQPSECDMITTKFHHLWEIKNDKFNNQLAKQ